MKRLVAVALLVVLLLGMVRLVRAGEVFVPLADPALTEPSGLAASPAGGVLWMVEDSGNGAWLHALDPGGAGLAAWSVTGAINRDWEDLAVAFAPDGTPMLLVADIGDNQAVRSAITLYRIPEPPSGYSGETVHAEAITLSYPDGPRDAEAILVHPWTGETLIVAKRWGTANVYRVAWEDPPRLELAGRVDGPGIGPFGQITGGAVSPDGQRIALLTYGGIAEWDVAEGETLAAALDRSSRRIPHPGGGQTEAIAYAADGLTLYVMAEGTPGQIAAIPLDPAR
jgi:hypothetical protein